MKRSFLLLVPALFLLAGCGKSEEQEVPLSPQAQAALKSGNTGIPADAKAGIAKGPSAADLGRGADMKKRSGN